MTAKIQPIIINKKKYWIDHTGLKRAPRFLSAPEIPDHRQICICRDWLSRWAAKSKTINRRKTSYDLKHTVEGWVRLSGGRPIYISHGAFIAAVLMEDYHINIVDNNCRPSDPISIYLAMSLPRKKALREAAGLSAGY